MHKETLTILAAQVAMCPGTIEASEINAMIARNHPLLAMIDGLLRMAIYSRDEFDSRIADDYFTGPYWIEAAKNVRGMFSSASPAGFSAGACEAVFWRAMEIAGFTEGDL